MNKLGNKELFFAHLAQTSPAPFALEISHAEGCYVHGVDGRAYLDLISGIAVSHLGHSNPEIIKAINEQLEKHLHVMVYGEFIQSSQIRLAHRITSLLPDSLTCCYFVNSGSEAVEGALKLAVKYTGRSGMASFNGAYHGSTLGAMSLMGNESLKSPYRNILRDVMILPFNDISALDELNDSMACVIIEPVQGEAGVLPADAEFLRALRRRCDELNSLLIFDEIQSGLGRTGSLFYFMQSGVTPDILLTAKAFGGGLPLGAFISSHAIMQALTDKPALSHITTFGGHPLSCAAGDKALEILTRDHMMESVSEKTRLFVNRLNALPGMQEIRQCGLMIALDFGDEQLVSRAAYKALELGLMIDWFLFNPKSIRIAPPLNISHEEILIACNLIEQAVSSC